MLRTLLLGVRLARPSDRGGWARVALIALGAFVGVVAVLSSFSIPGVAIAQANHLAGQQPRLVGDGAFEAGRQAPMRVKYREDEHEGEVLTRIVLAAVTADAEVPGWLDRFPGPGEIVVSPRLRSLIVDESSPLARRFPQRVVGVIGDEGLVSPDQLIAIIGVSRGELPARNGVALAASGLGRPEVDHPGPAPGAIRAMATGAAVFLVLPALVLVATSARLSARTRQRKLAALRLMGISGRQALLVNAVGIVLVTAVGASVGAIAWNVGARVSEPIGLGPLRWFAEDVGVAVPAQLLVVVLVVIGATAVTLGGSLAAIVDPIAVRRDIPRSIGYRRGTARLAPLVIGVGLLVVTLLWSQPEGLWFALFGAGNVAAAIGLFTAVPVIARSSGRMLSRQSRSPGAVLAGRRLVHEPSAAARVAGGLLIVVLTAGFGQTLSVTLDWAINTNVHHRQDDRLAVITIENARFEPTTVNPSSGSGVIIPSTTLTSDGKPVAALVMTCETMRAISTTATDGCRDDVAQPLSSSIRRLDKIPIGPALGFTYSDLSGATIGGGAPLKVSPSLLDSAQPLGDSWLVAVDHKESAESIVGQVLGLSPAAEITGLPGVDRGRLVRTYSTLVLAGTVAAICLGLLAAIAGLVDRTLERRVTSNQLLALGVPGRTLRSAEAVWVGAPLLLGMIATFASTALAGISYLRLGADALQLPVGAISLVVAVGAMSSVVAIIAAAAVTPVHPRGRFGSDAL